jgi:hypothetical protein
MHALLHSRLAFALLVLAIAGGIATTSAGAVAIDDLPPSLAILEGSPASIDFGTQVIDPAEDPPASVVRVVTITNVGTDYAGDLDAYVYGDASQLEVLSSYGVGPIDGVEPCERTLRAGSICFYQVSFRPTIGTFSGGLVVMPKQAVDMVDGERAAEVALTASGVRAAPVPSLAPDRLAFYGRSRYDPLPQVRRMVVRNPTPAALRVRRVSILGAGRRAFAPRLVGSCAARSVVPARSSCPIAVSLLTRAVRLQYATLRVDWFGSRAPVTARLVGAACDPERVDNPLDPEDGDQQLDTYACGRRVVLRGTRGRDVAHGSHGNDRMAGGAGDDSLFGHAGDDLLDGGSGNDRLVGGPGRDVLRGGAGDDGINAADGWPDRVDCGPGRDTANVDADDRVTGCERAVVVATPIT